MPEEKPPEDMSQEEMAEEIKKVAEEAEKFINASGQQWSKRGFKDAADFRHAQESFAQLILCQEQERLREQPSKSSAHNLALQQALGRLAEVVHSGRGFLDVWGAQCTPVNFLIQVILKDKDGHEVSHGITLKELVASVAPCGESYAGQIDNLVLRTLRNVSWTLACVTQEAAQLHAQLEGELFKDTREAEAIAKSSGDSEWSVG